MIEFKARGNGLLEARGDGSIMFTLQYVDFELNCIIISEQKNCCVYKYSLQNNQIISKLFTH